MEFPQEIIYIILSKTPIKSLARFRCVCKSWLEYINDPYLDSIHVEEEPTPIKFQPYSYFDPKKKIIKEYCKISRLRVTQATCSSTNVNIKKEPLLQFCCNDWFLKKQVLGSCKGLTLLRYKENDYDGTFLALINPLTKQRHNLPPVKVKRDNWNRFYPATAAGIGFDDSTNTFKTVCVVTKEFEFLPSQGLCTVVVHDSGTSSWREIPRVPAYPIRGDAVFAYGRLHWTVSPRLWSPSVGTKVVWFDVKTEEFGLIDPPKRKGGRYWIEDHLVNLNGDVGFVAYIDDGNAELWMLKRGEWVLHCRIDLYPCSDYYGAVVLGCWNKQGDLLLTFGGEGKRLFVYTLKTGDLRILGRGDRHEGDIIMYRNNLFSIRTSAYFVKDERSMKRRRKNV